MSPAGVYLHFPFCSARCSYCDFPTVAGRDDRIDAYLDALVREIRTGQPGAPSRADTVFLGGGTPSRMTPEQVRRVLDAVRGRFDLDPGPEVTLEANPESLSPEHLAGYRDAGVTRISVGVQSLDDRVLAGSGRAHDAARGERAVREALAAGFRCVGVDLIAGLPGEDLGRWTSTVQRAASLGAGHLSVYLLETDKDTPLSRGIARGRVRVANDDHLAQAWRESVAALRDAGLVPYEISNFARPGAESRHNLKYWTDAPYAGFGLGAHGYFAGARRANRRDLDGYLSDVAAGRDPGRIVDPWDPRRRVDEALILGLRLVRGVDLDALGRRYGTDLRALHRAAWDRATEAGLLETDGTSRIRLTESGRLKSNELFTEILRGQVLA